MPGGAHGCSGRAASRMLPSRSITWWKHLKAVPPSEIIAALFELELSRFGPATPGQELPKGLGD